MSEQKRINPFDKFKRANQLTPPRKTGNISTFRNEGQQFSDVKMFANPNSAAEATSISPGESAPKSNADTKSDSLQKLKEAHANFSSNVNAEDAKKSKDNGKLLHPDPKKAIKFFRPSPISKDFDAIDREDYLDRARGLLNYIQGYYGISEEETLDEMLRISESDNRSMVLRINGLEYAAQHVRVVSDDRFVREIVFFENPTLERFFALNGVQEDVLERSAYADELSKVVSAASSRTKNR